MYKPESVTKSITINTNNRKTNTKSRSRIFTPEYCSNKNIKNAFNNAFNKKNIKLKKYKDEGVRNIFDRTNPLYQSDINLALETQWENYCIEKNKRFKKVFSLVNVYDRQCQK